MEPILEATYSAIIDGDLRAAQTHVQSAVDAGQPAEAILQQALIPAMKEVGRRFEEGEYFVPEMLISARAMQSGLAILRPLLAEADVAPAGKVVIGTVQGDLHDIGKNLVAMMLEGAGFEIVDLGTDVPAEKFVQAVQESEAQIVAMSALLTTTMPKMNTTIQALQEAGLRDQVKVMIGGAPVTADYGEKIGADGYAADASRAASLAKEFMR
jgi:5-methyltetrahydrofolate--homocysteine methyltransferase